MLCAGGTTIDAVKLIWLSDSWTEVTRRAQFGPNTKLSFCDDKAVIRSETLEVTEDDA